MLTPSAVNHNPKTAFRKSFWLLGGLMVTFLVLRLIAGNLRQGDAESYFAVADLIKDGSYFRPDYTDNATLLTLRPFLYPALLIFPGLSSVVVVLILQTVLGIWNIHLMLALFRRWGGTGVAPLVVCTVLTPAIFIYTHLVMTEALVMTLVLLLALLLAGGLTMRKVVWAQPLLILLVFLKPVFYLFTVVSLVFFIVYFTRIRKFHWIILLPLLMVLGYMGFNRYRTGYFHFSSIQNVNLVDYNLNLFLIKQQGPEAALAWRRDVYAKAEQQATFRDKQEVIAAEAKKTIRAHFAAYTVFHLYGALRGMIDPGRADLALFSGNERPEEGLLFNISKLGYRGALQQLFRSGNGWQLLLLVPIFIAGLLKWLFVFIHLWCRKKMIGFASAYLILFTGFYILVTGPVNASRYMMPLQGLLIVAAVIGWQNARKTKPGNPSI